MKNKMLRLAGWALGAALVAAPAVSAERSEIPDRYKWDLSTLYADEAGWAAAKDSLRKDIPQLARWQGRLGESAATLLAAMSDREKAYRQLERVYVYASALSHEDTRAARTQQMQQQATQVYSELQTATAFIRPELLAVGRPTIERFLAEEPRLDEIALIYARQKR